MTAPRKRSVDEITTMIEPTLSIEQRVWLEEGIRLFNNGEPWHAHEQWEKLWLTMPDGRSGDAEIILRGLIQLAAAVHLLSQPGREEGARSNFRKAREKLALAPTVFLGIRMESLVEYIDGQLAPTPDSLRESASPRITLQGEQGEGTERSEAGVGDR